MTDQEYADNGRGFFYFYLFAQKNVSMQGKDPISLAFRSMATSLDAASDQTVYAQHWDGMFHVVTYGNLRTGREKLFKPRRDKTFALLEERLREVNHAHFVARTHKLSKNVADALVEQHTQLTSLVGRVDRYHGWWSGESISIDVKGPILPVLSWDAMVRAVASFRNYRVSFTYERPPAPPPPIDILPAPRD